MTDFELIVRGIVEPLGGEVFSRYNVNNVDSFRVYFDCVTFTIAIVENRFIRIQPANFYDIDNNMWINSGSGNFYNPEDDRWIDDLQFMARTAQIRAVTTVVE